MDAMTKKEDIYLRMAELWIIQNGKGLSEEEGQELDTLLRMNADNHWSGAKACALAEIAERTGDKLWAKKIYSRYAYETGEDIEE